MSLKFYNKTILPSISRKLLEIKQTMKQPEEHSKVLADKTTPT